MTVPDPTHRVRAFGDLAQFQDKDLFAELAEGLAAIHENAARLTQGMETAKAAGNVRAARVLAALANEECGKYLILLDAVRCHRNPPETLVKHLAKAGEHLAKGIYADGYFCCAGKRYRGTVCAAGCACQKEIYRAAGIYFQP